MKNYVLICALASGLATSTSYGLTGDPAVLESELPLGGSSVDLGAGVCSATLPEGEAQPHPGLTSTDEARLEPVIHTAPRCGCATFVGFTLAENECYDTAYCSGECVYANNADDTYRAACMGRGTCGCPGASAGYSLISSNCLADIPGCGGICRYTNDTTGDPAWDGCH